MAVAIDWGQAFGGGILGGPQVTFGGQGAMGGTTAPAQQPQQYAIQQQYQAMQWQSQQTACGGTLITSGNYFYNCTGTSTNVTNNIIFNDNTWTIGAGGGIGNVQIIQQPISLTPEQIEQLRLQQAEWAEREKQAREEFEAAELKAQALIEEILDADARKQLKANGYIDVPVTRALNLIAMHNREGRLLRFQGAFKFYRIRANSGVYLVDKDGKEKGYLCIHSQHPDGVLPPSDDLIAKYWLAKVDEERLWTVANFFAR